MKFRAAFFVCIAGCLNANHLVISTSPIDEHTPSDTGDDYDFEHVATDGYTRQKTGFYVVRDENDWRAIWKDTKDSAAPPSSPAKIDYKKKMIFVATSPSDDAKLIEVQKVTHTFAGLQIYVVETLPPKNCPPRAPLKSTPMDIVAFDTVKDDVHVHYDRLRAETCGPPPDAVAVCRVAGSGAAGSEKLASSPGDSIDCDSTQSKPQEGKIIDRQWQLLGTPAGSATKLTIGKDNIGVTFPVDAWGSYQVSLSIRDATREGSAIAIVGVLPPDLGIELFWQRADPSAPPRGELHVVELPFGIGSANADCSSTMQKPWCEVHTVLALQQALLRPESNKRYHVLVKYADARMLGGPVACLRVFPKGAPAITTCDSDDAQRKAGAAWDVGALDPARGNFYDPRLSKPPVATANADAGAPAPTFTGTVVAPPPTHTTVKPPPPPPPTSTSNVVEL